jgi:acyl-CoA synthetase (AMP-forming)/AMP-acid ligase II
VSANLAARLAERADRHPDRLAIVEYRKGRARRVTFGELNARVAALGAGIRAAGVRPGERVLLFVPMSIDLYVALLAVLHAGATAVFVDAWADRARLDAAVAAADPALFIGTPKAQLLRLLSRAVRRIPRHWTAARRWPQLARHEAPAARTAAERVEADAPALVTFTTGSTGAPRAAARSHGFLWAQHEVLAAHLQLRPDDVDMPTLPVFVLNNLALGIPSVLPDFDARRPAEIVPRRIVRQLRREGVTTTSGSPAFYDRLSAWAEMQGERLALRGLWTGGAPVYPPLAERLARSVSGEVHIVYGSTEAEPIAGTDAETMLAAMAEEDTHRLGGLFCGAPVPEIRVRIVRPHDGAIALGAAGWAEWELPRGEAGEIIVAGAHVLGEYYNAPAETRRHKIHDGEAVWHRTGDAGYLDAEGRLWLVGRVGARVERAGRTWWSVPAEVRALGVASIAHAAYFGEPDPALGQRAVLCVEAVPRDALEPELRTALGAVPFDRLFVLPHIPRDPRHASKTDLTALRRSIAALRPEPTGAKAPRRHRAVGTLLLLALLALSTAPLDAQLSGGERATNVALNGVLGAATAGVRQAIKGRFDWNGILRGAGGGALMGVGKQVAGSGFDGSGLIARPVHALGVSLVHSADRDQPVYLLPIGPLTLELRPGTDAPVHTRLDVTDLVILATSARDERTRIDWAATLSAGAPVLVRPIARMPGGYHAHGLAFVGTILLAEETAGSGRRRTLAHEQVHVLQWDALRHLATHPAERAVVRRIPLIGRASAHLDVGLLAPGGMYLIASRFPYEQHPWEREAYLLAGHAY